MKRFLSLLLCICMLTALLPATIVAENIAEAADPGITIKYSPWGPGDVLYQKANVEVTNFTTYESTLGYWRYVKSSNGNDKYKYAAKNWEAFQLDSYGGVNGWVAFAINVPVAGEYNLTLDIVKYPDKGITQGAMYIAPISTDLDTVVNNSSYLVTDKIDYTTMKSVSPGTWNFPTAGEYYVVYKCLSNDATMYPGVLTLSNGTGKVAMGVKTSVAEAEIDAGKTTQASAMVYMSDETTSTNVTYSSSDTSVATVDATTGVVTGLKAGTATITATYTDAIIGEVKATTDVTVTGSVAPQITLTYSPWGPGDVLYQKALVEVTNFTTYDSTLGFWRYVGSANNKDKYKYVAKNWESFQLHDYGGKNGWVAFAINVPVAGKYNVDFKYTKYSEKGVIKGAMYIAPGSVDVSTIVNNSEYLVANNIDYRYVGSANFGEWNFPTAGEYYVVYQALSDIPDSGETNAIMYPGVLTLSNGTGNVAMGVKVNVAETEIDAGKTTQASATVYMSDETTSTNVTYSSSDTSIATVDATTGVVTGVSGGVATITATYTDAVVGEVKGTTKVTVNGGAAAEITIKYSPWGPGDVLYTKDNVPLTNFMTYESTLGYWRYVKAANNNNNSKNVARNWNAFMLYGYGGKNGWVAFAINVPAAGVYDINLDIVKYPDKGITQGAMYIAPISADLDTVVNNSSYLVTDKIDYTSMKSVSPGAWSFPTAGEYYVVYQALSDVPSSGEAGAIMYPGVLTLTSGTGCVAMGVKASVAEAEIDPGMTTQASATVYMSDETTNTTVTYSSSDTNIATVDAATGVVTGVSGGTATITATYTDAIIGEVKGTTDVKVSAVAKAGYTIKYKAIPDGMPTGSTQIKTITDYSQTKGFWKFYGKTPNAGSDKYLYIWNNWRNCMQFNTYGGASKGFVALKINVPVEGYYNITQKYARGTAGADKVGLYVLPGNVALGDIITTIDGDTTGLYLVSDEINCYDSSTSGSGPIYDVTSMKHFVKGDNILVYRNLSGTDTDIFIGDIILNGGSGSVAMGVDVHASRLGVGATSYASATVYMSDGTIKSDVSYSSSHESVATVDATTGALKGISEGTTMITATHTDAIVGEVKGTTEVSVTEYTGAGLKLVYDMWSAERMTYFDDLTTYYNTKGFWRYAGASKSPSYMYVHNDYNCLFISAYGGKDGWAALGINVPVAGFYKVSFEHLRMNTGTTQGAMYIAPATVDPSSVISNNAYLLTDAINYNSETPEMNTIDLGTRYFPTAGEYYVVYKAISSDASPMFPGNITLNGDGNGKAIMMSDATIDSSDVGVGDIARITVIDYMSDFSQKKATDVSFSSSNDAVATVTSAGVVTGVSEGEATITVKNSAGTTIGEIDVNVVAISIGSGEYFYDMVPEDAEHLARLNTMTYEKTNDTWKFFTNRTKNEKYMALNKNYHYCELTSYGGYQGWVAIKIKVPVAGRYGVNLTSGKRYAGCSQVGMYIYPGDTDESDITGLTEEGVGLITDEIDCYNPTITTPEEKYVGVYNFKEAGEYIVVYKQLSNEDKTTMYIGDIRLDSNNIISEIDLTIDDMEINWSEKTNLHAVVHRLDRSIMGDREYKISFDSSDPGIASVSNSGVITGTGDGSVVITATATDGNRTVTEKVKLVVHDNTGFAGTFIDVPDELYQREASKIDFKVQMNSGNAYAIPFENVTFTVEPAGIVEINDGIITAGAESLGEVTITASGIFQDEERFFEKTISVIVDDGKNTSSYFTDEKREAAKENAAKYGWAKDIVKSAVTTGDAAVESAMYLYYHVPGEGVPRGRHVGTPNDPDYNRCRYCGVNIEQKYGDWSINVYTRPWKIQCPDCKRYFPSNDFGSFLKLGQDELGRFDVNRARQAHHEKFVCENAKNGGTCECVAPTEEYSDAWCEFYGYGLPGGYLYNDLYSELRNETGALYNKDPYKKDEDGNPLSVDGMRWGVDDGWGYIPGRAATAREEERCGYIAMYGYLMWNQTNATLRRLKDAYVYTSDIKYGRAGAILLDRIADIYPGYDIYPYADYFLNTHGGTDIGSLQGCINDTSFAKSFAEATDAFYPALSDPQLIKFLSERAEEYNLENDKSSSKLIWENWEANILEHIFKMAKQNRLTGNFGMLQGALSITAIALDKEPETTEMIEWIYQTGVADGTGNEKTLSGGNVASQLVDKVDRDGIGSESGPGYNFMWLSYIMEMGKYLAEYQGKADVNLYDNAKFIQMFIAPTRLVLTDSHHVQVGDSGTTASLEFKSELATALEGFINIKDERVRKILAQYIYIVNGKTTEGINYGIFAKDPERAETELLAYIEEDSEPISEMLTGYGFAVLRDGKEYDSASSLTAKNNMRDFWMYFGNASSHKHFDALTFGMEAYGLNVAPDLGYPENTGTDPNRLQWVQATIAHNTVTVDERDQESDGQPNALPMHFDDTDAVKLMDISAPDAYTQVDNYRRSIVMIKVDDDVSYGVDFFRVTGGQKHTYSFHSQAENAVATSGLELVADPVVQDKYGRDIVGSYAGPDVPFGQDPDTIDEWFYETRYPRGYTWMRRPRRDMSPADNFSVEFDVRDYNGAISDGKDITLRMTQINNFTPDEVAIVAGYVPKRNANIKLPETLDYVLTQRYAQNGESLDSLFTTVFEPYKGERYIENIEAVEVSGNVPEGEMVRAIKVTHTNGDRIDYVIYATDNSETYTVKDTNGESVFTFRGFVGLYSLNADGAVLYRYVNDGDVIDGTGDESTGSISEYTGTVAGCTQQLSLDNYIDVNMQCNDLASLSGKYIYVDNDGKQNGVYRIDGAAQSPNGDGTIRLDIGMISLIRAHRNTNDVNAGYIYNVAQGQSFRIPMSYSEDYSPVFTSENDTFTASAGRSIKFKVSAESPIDENAPTIEYVGTTLPRGASLDSATGEITWKPDSSQIGENHFAITARDSDGRESTIHFTITVYGSTTGGGTGGSGSTGAPTTPSTPSTPTIPATPGADNKDDVPQTPGTTTPTTPDVDSNVRFIDLGNHVWAADAINALADEGIIKGTSENTFSPANNITRADFAILLVRAFKLESDNTENFLDVLDSDYFAKELAIARNTGIVNGIGDNKYAPKNTITRQDMMLIVYRALAKLDVEIKESDVAKADTYEDLSEISDYAKEAVTALVNAGFVNGKSGKIAPTDYTTRAEVAVLIKRILDYTK